LWPLHAPKVVTSQHDFPDPTSKLALNILLLSSPAICTQASAIHPHASCSLHAVSSAIPAHDDPLSIGISAEETGEKEMTARTANTRTTRSEGKEQRTGMGGGTGGWVEEAGRNYFKFLFCFSKVISRTLE